MEGWGGRRECRAERGQCGPGEAGQLQLVYILKLADYAIEVPMEMAAAEDSFFRALGFRRPQWPCVFQERFLELYRIY